MPEKEIPKTEEPLQERILDAVERCFARQGIQKTTLADIAAQVGVSRMTVYRQFKDRQALFNGAALRNLRRHWQRIGDQLQGVDALSEWLLEGVLFYQREIADNAEVKLYARLEAFDEGMAVALSEPGLAAVIVQFQPLYDAALKQGHIAEGLSEEAIAEWVHRTNHTLIHYPSPRMNSEIELRRWLGAQINGGLICGSGLA